MSFKDDLHEELEQRSAAREILGAVAKEMGLAVNSIRQEVVEKGWFGERGTPDMVQEWGREDARDPEIAGAQDFRKEDLYGCDPERIEREQKPERDLDQEIDR